jgi:hypothetical protein
MCRLRYNSTLIDDTKVDDIKTLNINGKKMNVRIVTYSIITDKYGKIDNTCKINLTETDIKNGYKENKYYMITNLCDQNEYTIEIIKHIYHLRWSIEEFFKYIKTYCQFDYLIENDINSIKKTIYAVLIISQLIHIIIHEYSIKNLIVNKSLLTEGIYDEFLIKLIYGDNFDEEWITFFLSIYVKTYSARPNRQSNRICISPCNKSYRKYKGNKQISNNAINDGLCDLGKPDNIVTKETCTQIKQIKLENTHNNNNNNNKTKKITKIKKTKLEAVHNNKPQKVTKIMQLKINNDKVNKQKEDKKINNKKNHIKNKEKSHDNKHTNKCNFNICKTIINQSINIVK